jgi:hypothetical protein
MWRGVSPVPAASQVDYGYAMIGRVDPLNASLPTVLAVDQAGPTADSHIFTGTGLTPATLRGDWARPCHICTGTGLTPATPATSAPGPGPPPPHLPSASGLGAHPGHICTGTCLAAATSALGLGSPLAGARSARLTVRRKGRHASVLSAQACEGARG